MKITKITLARLLPLCGKSITILQICEFGVCLLRLRNKLNMINK